jgi:hypothetical protein
MQTVSFTIFVHIITVHACINEKKDRMKILERVHKLFMTRKNHGDLKKKHMMISS